MLHKTFKLMNINLVSIDLITIRSTTEENTLSPPLKIYIYNFPRNIHILGGRGANEEKEKGKNKTNPKYTCITKLSKICESLLRRRETENKLLVILTSAKNRNKKLKL